MRRLHLDFNWRYYFRIYYDYETKSAIQFNKNYSQINREELKITAWLNFTNETSLNSTCLIKTKLQTTTQNVLTSNQNTETESTSSISLINRTSSSFSSTTSQNQIDSSFNSNTFSNGDQLTTNEMIKISLLNNIKSNLSLNEILNNVFSTANTNQLNVTELFQVLENKTFQFDLKSESSFPAKLLESANLDINNCVSNCSNQGSCKLKPNGIFECLCNSNFTGSKCEYDKRLCSQMPCLNSIKCEDILIPKNQTSSYEFDFKCRCRSDLFYGKRCESKVNLCQNETCSGNGVCKIIQIDKETLNETINCECFGQNDFEGEKCQTKSAKMILKETTIKATAWIAISCVILFYSLIFLMDLHRFLTRFEKTSKKSAKIKEYKKRKFLF